MAPRAHPEMDEPSWNPRMWVRQLDFERATNEIESAMQSLILDELNGTVWLFLHD